VMPDDTPAHPYPVSMDIAALAPKAEVTVYPWREPKDLLAKTVPPFDALLSWYPPTGDLSGITSLSVLAWLVVWAGLSRAWRGRSVNSGRVLGATLILTLLGVIVTFPPTALLVPW